MSKERLRVMGMCLSLISLSVTTIGIGLGIVDPIFSAINMLISVMGFAMVVGSWVG